MIDKRKTFLEVVCRSSLQFDKRSVQMGHNIDPLGQNIQIGLAVYPVPPLALIDELEWTKHRPMQSVEVGAVVCSCPSPSITNTSFDGKVYIIWQVLHVHVPKVWDRVL